MEAGEDLAGQLPGGWAWVPLRVQLVVLVLVVLLVVCGEGPTWVDVQRLPVWGEVSRWVVRRE